MFLLASTALAATYALPIRATASEFTYWGDDPTLVDDVQTATVAVSNPTTGVKFATTGELLLREKTGEGVGELQFDRDPSGTLHTWAITLLDGEGNVIGKEPQVVDVLFGNHGDGTVVAREQGNIIIKTPRIKKKNPRITQDDGNYDLTLTVQGVGTDAAYVGIQELAADGSPLGVHTDMRAMTAGVYASYQALLLDAIVPLDTWSATVEGTVYVDGLTVGKRTVEGGANLDFDVSFWGRSSGTKASIVPLGVVQYAKTTTPKPKQESTTLGEISALAALKLLPADESPDSYDGSFELVVDGDARDLEIGALLTPRGSAPAPLTGDLLALSPGDLSQGGTATFPYKNFPSTPETLTGAIEPLDAKGAAIADWAECVFTPTRLTVSKRGSTAAYVGECLRDDEGLERVRSVSLTLSSAGTGTATAEVLGLDWQKAAQIAFQIDGDRPSVGTVVAKTAVTETRFDLGFSFAEDADDTNYSLELLFFGATAARDFDLAGTGLYAWDLSGDPTWRATADGASASTVVKPERASHRTLNVDEWPDTGK